MYVTMGIAFLLLIAESNAIDLFNARPLDRWVVVHNHEDATGPRARQAIEGEKSPG